MMTVVVLSALLGAVLVASGAVVAVFWERAKAYQSDVEFWKHLLFRCVLTQDDYEDDPDDDLSPAEEREAAETLIEYVQESLRSTTSEEDRVRLVRTQSDLEQLLSAMD